MTYISFIIIGANFPQTCYWLSIWTKLTSELNSLTDSLKVDVNHCVVQILKGYYFKVENII